MISIWHLTWIIPLCILLGILSISIPISAGTANKEYDYYQLGVNAGYDLARQDLDKYGKLHDKNKK